VNACASVTLPGTPGKALEAVWQALSASQRQALAPHLLGDTGSKWISATLEAHGHRVSATAIKDYRQRLRQAGELS
jgi:hypothetical protein